VRPCVWVGLPVPVVLSPDGALCADLSTALEEASTVCGAAEGAAARRQVALGLAFIGTAAGPYTPPLFSSTWAVSDTKHTLKTL